MIQINTKNLSKKLSFKAVIIGIVHFIITLLLDHVFFQGEEKIHFLRYFGAKALTLVILIFLWHFIFNLSKEIKNGNRKLQDFLKFFCIYFAFSMIILLLLWPGVWRWDEFDILRNAKSFSPFFWQHWLTSLFYILSLCIIPCPGGIIIVQIFLISLIIGKIMAELNAVIKSKWTYAFYIPFLLPAIITNNLYPMRIVLCSYLELLFLCLVTFSFIKKQTPSNKKLILWGTLIGVVAAWRSEAIIYVVLGPALVFILLYKKVKLKALLSLFMSAALTMLSISFVQKLGKREDDYFITGIMEQLHAVVSTNFSSDSPEEDLKVIDKVLDVEMLKNFSGGSAFWDGGKRDYIKEDFENFKKVSFKLFLKNIPVVLANRLDLFIRTNGMVPNEKTTLGCSPDIYSYAEKDFVNESYWRKSKEFAENYKFNVPINVSLRSGLLKILECKKLEDSKLTTIWTPVFYNCIPCAIMLFSVFLYGIIRRKKLWILISVIPIIKMFLIFITAPINAFMYYLPVYVVGLSLGVICLLVNLKERVLPNE